ncbi:CBS domain-containing protein [Streptomyces sp. NPDC055287]
MRHAAAVERSWFRVVANAEDVKPPWPGEVDGTFAEFHVDDADVDEAFEVWREECAHARAVAASFNSLDDRQGRGGRRRARRPGRVRPRPPRHTAEEAKAMPHRRSVGDVMTEEVVTLRPDTPFQKVAALLDANDIASAPVVDHDGAPVGSYPRPTCCGTRPACPIRRGRTGTTSAPGAKSGPGPRTRS